MIEALLGGIVGALLVGVGLYALVLHNGRGRAWGDAPTRGQRESAALDVVLGLDDRPMVQRRVTMQADVEPRAASRARFETRAVTDLVQRGVPRSVAEQEAALMWDAVDLSLPSL